MLYNQEIQGESKKKKSNYELAKCWVFKILGHLKKFKYLCILVLFQRNNESQSIPLNLQPA